MNQVRRFEIMERANKATSYRRWLEVVRDAMSELLTDQIALFGLIMMGAGRWKAKGGTVDFDAAINGTLDDALNAVLTDLKLKFAMGPFKESKPAFQSERTSPRKVVTR